MVEISTQNHTNGFTKGVTRTRWKLNPKETLRHGIYPRERHEDKRSLSEDKDQGTVNDYTVSHPSHLQKTTKPSWTESIRDTVTQNP